MDERRPHPYFDDRGTLSWHTRWKDALAEAQRERKKIFVEFGREQCGLCRALVQSVVPRPDFAQILREHFVALASDCDDAEDEVADVARHLEDAYMLPFVLFTDSSGKFLEGTSGSVNPITFAANLKRIAGLS